MLVLLAHSDDRGFEMARFGAAWARAGGDPAELVPASPATAAGLAADPRVSGLLLSGGPDVEPGRYGAAPEAGIALHVQPERDALDLDLLARAEREAWPVLAVCYGCQLLAVAHGGTLVQDLASAGKTGHKITEPKDRLAHDVEVSGSARFLPHQGPRLAVNSRHHQAIARLGPGMIAVATAPDGVIEAIEPAAGDRFVLGVQWHPENMAQPEQVAILAAFRRACLARAAARPAP